MVGYNQKVQGAS